MSRMSCRDFSKDKQKPKIMVNQTILSHQLTPNLVNTVQQLSSSLKAIQPLSSDNQTTRIITYALVATAITGIFVYHYLKSQENI